ncbi:CidA/LrgA family protein [Subdoligranulum variabile]|uniref:LrgA family protein n=1 Tax=Subdoligranulum variabile DSM 15176 TaxID=411471 RepID=D1PJQ8_9FIRM|nr:CidA/LrgA family protein [Subdoligranulum variabile]EFB77006.1 LrgA family protein [Subdoligranulum variabile DSM 15176]UWP67672.1 CidA/LrgA family protein [Subdoligranulum variabile]
MKFVFQFARIVGFCLLGEALAAVLPLPIPASVYGLLLMVAALKLRLLRLEQVRETGLFLTGIFPLLFVPAASGVMELGSQLADVFVPVVIAIIPITALVMAVTGLVAQHCTAGQEVESHE